MSDERPTSDADAAKDALDEVRATDADAWAKACAEDLAAEKARRRVQNGQPPGSAAEELRKLVDAVADKLTGLQSPLLGAVAGGAAQQMVNQVVQQAKAAVEPVIERNPDVFDHLATAGSNCSPPIAPPSRRRSGAGPPVTPPRAPVTRAPVPVNTSTSTEAPRVRLAVAGLDRN